MDTIKFACMRCDQRFCVSSRNRGRQLRCPACGHRIRVPSAEIAAVQLADRAAQRRQREWPEFKVDPDHPLDYLEDEEDPSQRRFVRRLTVWGCLIIILGIFAYRAGVRWGLRHGSPSPAEQRRNLQAIPGRVVGLDRAGGPLHSAARDVLLVAIPSDRQLDQRIPAVVMLPDARDSLEFQNAVKSIQFIGGDVAISDHTGHFAWKLATPDVYEVIAVSNAPGNREIPRSDLAAVGHLFVPAYDLMAGRRYTLRHRVHIAAGDQLTMKFQRD